MIGERWREKGGGIRRGREGPAARPPARLPDSTAPHHHHHLNRPDGPPPSAHPPPPIRPARTDQAQDGEGHADGARLPGLVLDPQLLHLPAAGAGGARRVGCAGGGRVRERCAGLVGPRFVGLVPALPCLAALSGRRGDTPELRCARGTRPASRLHCCDWMRGIANRAVRLSGRSGASEEKGCADGARSLILDRARGPILVNGLLD